MKKIIFMVLYVLLLVSCSEEQRQKLLGSQQVEPSCKGWYRGHRYLVWMWSSRFNGIIHDPDCPCHLDTLSIYVVDKNDTTYIIEKK